MPNSKYVRHPSGKLGIFFTEDNHLYVDDFGFEYTSSTTLVHSAFEAFNPAKAAAAKAARTGVPAEHYLKEWQTCGQESARLGTRTHENCERQILGMYSNMHQPENHEEQARFRAAWFEVERLKTLYLRLEPEKLIFSPRFRIAGSIDLLGLRHDGSYSIIDWKFIKELKMTAFRNKTGVHFATRHLPDCNFYHYALQTNIYDQILRVEGYIPAMAAVDKWLAVYDFIRHKFDFVKMPELQHEALLLMAFQITSDNLDFVPF